MILVIDKEKEGLMKFYKLLDMDTGEVQWGSELYVQQMINSGKICMENALVRFGRLTGTNGDFGRFAKIRKKTGKEPAIIVNEIVNPDGVLLGYRMANIQGVMDTVGIADAIKVAESGILFNGVLKKASNNALYIAPIGSDYPREVFHN